MTEGAQGPDSLKRLREQLVALSVDLDDKTKLGRSLLQRVEAERQAIAAVEQDVDCEFSSQLQREAAEQQVEIERAIAAVSALVQEKKTLLTSCQECMDEIDRRERLMDAELRELARDGELELEQDRRVYRSSYEDRLQLAIAQRLKYHKDLTSRALEPEIHRLKSMHERDMAELEASLHRRQDQLKEDVSRRLASRIAAADTETQREHLATLRSMEETFERDLAQLRSAHRAQLAELQSESVADLAKNKSAVAAQLEQERIEHQQELQRLQDHSQVKISELKQRQARELADVEKEFEIKRNNLKSAADISRRAIERVVKDELVKSATSTSTENRSSRSPDKKSVENRAFLSIETDAATAALLKARDQTLQAEIKSMQLETVRLEREWTIKATADASAAVDAGAREEQLLKKQLQVLSEQITQAIVDNRGLSGRELPALRQRDQALGRELETLQQEKAKLAVEIKERQLQTEKLVVMQKRRFEEEHELYLADIQQQRDAQQVLARELSQLKERSAEVLSDLEADYDQKLEGLDLSVKRQIAEKDELIVHLNSGIDDEKAAILRLRKLADRYLAQRIS